MNKKNKAIKKHKYGDFADDGNFSPVVNDRIFSVRLVAGAGLLL